MGTSQALIAIARFIEAYEWYCAGVLAVAAVQALRVLAARAYAMLPGTKRREAARRKAERDRLDGLCREAAERITGARS